MVKQFIKMYVNTPYGRIRIKNKHAFNKNRMRMFINNAILEYLEGMHEQVKQYTQDRFSEIGERPLPGSDAEHLRDAYLTSIEPEITLNKGGKISIGFFNLQKIDDAVNPGRDKNRGWWKLHEFGSPGSLVGGSSEWAFTPSHFFNRDVGRHGEGIMLNIGYGFGKTLFERGAIKPHRGFRPFRIITTVSDRIKKTASVEIKTVIKNAIIRALET